MTGIDCGAWLGGSHGLHCRISVVGLGLRHRVNHDVDARPATVGDRIHR